MAASSFSCGRGSLLKFMFDKFPGFLGNLAIASAIDPFEGFFWTSGSSASHLHTQVQIYTQGDWFKH